MVSRLTEIGDMGKEECGVQKHSIRRSMIGIACDAAVGLSLAAWTLAGSARAEPSPVQVSEPTYDGATVERVYIPSFDGTRLAITLFRPTLHGKLATSKLPVIVQQANAAPQPESDATIRFFTEHGYIWAAQARRGTGASFGIQTGFVNELDAKDAKATIEWAGAQDFSSGKVVSFGCSNEGAWQYLAMKFRPRYWVAASVQCASPAIFDHGISRNGISFLPLPARPHSGECGPRPPAMPFALPPTTAPVAVDEDKDGKLLAAALAERSCNADFLGQYWLNMARDGYNAFAQTTPGLDDAAIMSAEAVKRSGVALLQIGGWFDAAVAGQFEGQRLWGGRVIMLPRSHGNAPAGYPGDGVDVNAESLRWFDHFAKGIANGTEAGVMYYTINAPAGSEWRRTPVWPPLAKQTTLYLAGSGLSAAKSSRGAKAVRYEQRDVAWFGGRFAEMHRDWDGDMSSADAASLVHTGPVLEHDVELTGTPVARLWISADQPDVNVFAVIEDVAPDGRSRYVTDGRLRASWRKLDLPPWGGSAWNWHRGMAADIRPLPVGKPTQLVFDFFPASYVFKQGHRLRLAIATSLGAAYQTPPLVGSKPVSLTLLRDKDHPSAIALPLVDRQR